MSKDEHPCSAIVEGDDASCAHTQGALTNEEVAVLGTMRKLKADVRELKRRRRLAQQSNDAASLAEIEPRLAASRVRWQELERERDEARRRRMIMLGHLTG